MSSIVSADILIGFCVIIISGLIDLSLSSTLFVLSSPNVFVVAKEAETPQEPVKRLTYTEALDEVNRKLDTLMGDNPTFWRKGLKELKKFKSYANIAKTGLNAFYEGFKDPDHFDWMENGFEIGTAVINLLATPGIDYVNDKELSTEILEIIEEKRFDSLYIMTTPDKPKGASDSVDEMFTPDEAVSNLEDSDIDSYYATTYYPWVKYFDKENNVYINLPATKDALRNMADVDNKKYPWYAPAGIERGNVECKKMHFFAKLEDEDTLYDGRINPLKTYSRDGVKIWGNKTMYTADTPMDRINVVRLMLYMRKLIIESTRGLIFEPNDVTLKSEFESIVNPILAQIKKDRGITDFRLNVSQTPEQMDAHELSATLYVKPTPTLEYIEINFVVTPQGVSFDSI